MLKPQFSYVLLTLLLGILMPTKAARFGARSFARQTRTPDQDAIVVTPYPNADELKPDIPFEEGITTVPDFMIPDAVYGPPEKMFTPELVYGPPEISENDLLSKEPAAESFPIARDGQQQQQQQHQARFNLARSQRFQRQRQALRTNDGLRVSFAGRSTRRFGNRFN